MDVAIAIDDPRSPDVSRLLEAHLAFAREVTPPEDVHALDVGSLVADDITLYSARRAGELLAIGALRHLDDTHVEIKSMHTAVSARRQGVGRVMLEHLVAEARQRGYRRVSLETGAMEAFAAARALYESHGFEHCDPFGSYQAKVASVCMTLRLD